MAGGYRQHDNVYRPHSSLSDLKPEGFGLQRGNTNLDSPGAWLTHRGPVSLSTDCN
jgi:hypothetical protein